MLVLCNLYFWIGFITFTNAMNNKTNRWQRIAPLGLFWIFFGYAKWFYPPSVVDDPPEIANDHCSG